VALRTEDLVPTYMGAICAVLHIALAFGVASITAYASCVVVGAS
jgi:hypothetical protein